MHSGPHTAHDAIVLSLVLPALNEKANLEVLLPRLLADWGAAIEILVVDDQSSDGTGPWLRAWAANDRRIRILTRIGHKGLASACVEGVLASAGPVVAIMDADLQHDEKLLKDMLAHISAGTTDIVTGSRFIGKPSPEGLSPRRRLLSTFGNRMANLLLPSPMTDPMTGFFMMRRQVFDASLPGLSPMGFKILFDLIVSAPNPSQLRITELPFTFKQRAAGASKLDSVVMWEFAMFFIERVLGRRIPARFISFSTIGAMGVVLHLSLVRIAMIIGITFIRSHMLATMMSIGVNFFLNNLLTYGSRRLKGTAATLRGLVSFYFVCGLGAAANVGVAAYLHKSHEGLWLGPAVAGILIGAIWNYGMSSFLTWRTSD